jgi:hypothetical protein
MTMLTMRHSRSSERTFCSRIRSGSADRRARGRSICDSLFDRGSRDLGLDRRRLPPLESYLEAFGVIARREALGKVILKIGG